MSGLWDWPPASASVHASPFLLAASVMARCARHARDIDPQRPGLALVLALDDLEINALQRVGQIVITGLDYAQLEVIRATYEVVRCRSKGTRDDLVARFAAEAIALQERRA